MAKRGNRRYTNKAPARVKHPEYYTEDYYHTSHTFKELQEVRRRLAKTANQRLVRLERAKSEVTGESYASFGAADIAYEYLDRQGRNRFSEQLEFYDSKSQDSLSIRREIATLQSFISAKSSSVAGQKEIEAKRLKTFSGKGIAHASNKEFYAFLNSDTFKNYSKMFDSETVIELYDSAMEYNDAGTAQAMLDSLYNEYTNNNKELSLRAITEGLQRLG